jgi:hypothetical protein
MTTALASGLFWGGNWRVHAHRMESATGDPREEGLPKVLEMAWQQLRRRIAVAELAVVTHAPRVALAALDRDAHRVRLAGGNEDARRVLQRVGKGACTSNTALLQLNG